MNHMDLKEIYSTFCPNTKEYTFSSALHRTFSKTVHIFIHKASLNGHKKTERATYTISNNDGLNVDFNKNIKLTNSAKLNNSLQNDHWVKAEMKKKIKAFLKLSENEGTTYLKHKHSHGIQ